MVNEPLLLVQPWFSELGHPAQSTLFFARALSLYVPVTVLVYVSSQDSAQLSLLDELSRIVSLEVIQGQKTNLPIGTWVSYQHIPTLLQRRSEIKKILFLDASLSALAASMLFRLPLDNYGIVAMQVTAPEVHLRGNFFKAGAKRKLYQLATQYRQLKVALRTPELTASWRKSGLIAPDACLELPTLELTNVTLPPQKSSISQRESLVFVVAGQLRPQKNIERIGPLFRNALAPGKLVVAGPMPGNLTASNRLAAIVTGSGDRICFIPEFLKESDLHKIVGKAHYNLMLYVDWDDRMEAAMLFTSARTGTPIIGHQSGWLGRMITEYELGYAINAYNPDEIRACLGNCALPGSAEYARFERGLRRLIADHQTEIVAPAFLSALDLSETQMGLNKLSGALQALIRRLGYHLSGLSLSAALDRVSSRSLEIGTVIDVGASNGQWSQIARQYYPDAFYFLMEANEVHEPALRLIKQKFPNVDYILAAVGDIVGEIFFDARDSFGGLASHTPIENSSSIRVPVVTIDTEVTKRNLKPPFLIKLDTHGFEVPIFEGAKHTLMQTNLIVVETYNFKLTKDSLMFYEMCSYLVSKGFRCIDLCDPMHRLKDKALWQFDLFFVPSTSKEFESNDYDS